MPANIARGRFDRHQFHTGNRIYQIAAIRYLYFQIVARKSRHHSAALGAFKQNLCRLPDISASKVEVQAVAQRLQFPDPRGRYRSLHLVRKIDGRSVRTLGEREYVQERRLYRCEKVVTAAELLLRFPREARDYVYSDERIRHRPTDGGNAVGEFGGRIASPHQRKHLVRAALERNMEMMLEFI